MRAWGVQDERILGMMLAMRSASRLVIGCMTGTSQDGVDAAAVRITGRGLGARVGFEGGTSGGLRSETGALRALAAGDGVSAEAVARSARALGDDHVAVIREIVERVGRPDLISVHGQTVFHRDGLNWQVMDPWGIARAFRVPVVFDLRGADIAHGGRGAPITPIADWMMFRDAHTSRCIVNLGGFCNITMLGAGSGVETIAARDVCACNQVLDDVARRVLGCDFDGDGRRAMAGRVDEAARDDLRARLMAQGEAHRSLGTGDEAHGWVDAWRERCRADDMAASACAAVGEVIGRGAAGAEEVYLAGGGVRNAALVAAVERTAKARTRALDVLGVPGAYREAAAMAVLGALCADGVAITLPGVTGVRGDAPMAGAWVFPDGPRGMDG
ncbi:MAG: anhydro-N-acetylmuramic acid kinase [Phycisphaeraceae bacterium]|nr:anhydro-N-acetylmuramic acid kinase [Phycisphaerales bacterium]MCB9843400.1 anhydro-N-acetylmuramic acid kinase [Phycisphaeraceae bacterium]